jgi:hypothetical protein
MRLPRQSTERVSLHRQDWPLSAVAGLLLALSGPLLLTAGSRDWLFTGGGIDPFAYIGYFLHYGDPLFNPADYKLARLPWILSGVLVHHLFAPVPAAIVLHLGFLTLSIAAFFVIVYECFGRVSVALTWSLALGLSPEFSDSGGWDYHNTAAGAFYLLSAAMVTVGSVAWRLRSFWIFTAGVFAALAIHSNITMVNTAPFLLVLLWVRSRVAAQAATAPWRRLAYDVLWMAAGAVAITVALGLVNMAVGRPFFFPRALLSLVTEYVADPENQKPWWQPWTSLWFLRYDYMALLWVAVFASMFVVVRDRARHTESAAAVLMCGTFLALFGIWTVWQTVGQTALDFASMAFPLFPHAFLALAAFHFALARRVQDLAPRHLWYYPVLMVLPWAIGLGTRIPRPELPVLVQLAAHVVVLTAAAHLLHKRRVAAGTALLTLGFATASSLSAWSPSEWSGPRTFGEQCHPARNAYEFVVGAGELWERFDPTFDRMTLWWAQEPRPDEHCGVQAILGRAVHGMFPAPGRVPMPALDVFAGSRLVDAAGTGRPVMMVSAHPDPLARVQDAMRKHHVDGEIAAQTRIEFDGDRPYYATVYRVAVRLPAALLRSRTHIATVTAADLLDSGQANQYDETAERLLQAQGNGARIVPSTPADHVATKMFDLSGATGWIQLQVTPAAREPFCRLQLQAQDYSGPEPLGCSDADGRAFVRTIKVAEGTRAVRLVFSAAGMRSAALPSRVEMWAIPASPAP